MLVAYDLLRYRWPDGHAIVQVPTSMRLAVLQAAHVTAHQLSRKMYDVLRLRIWWPALRREVIRYVENYPQCVRIRIPVPYEKPRWRYSRHQLGLSSFTSMCTVDLKCGLCRLGAANVS